MKLSANLDQDFSHWHGGCQQALVWALDVDREEVRARQERAQQLLGDLLISRYCRQPHVTVLFAGLNPEPVTHPTGRIYSIADRDRDIAALTSSDIGPIELSIGGWATFQMAPYLEVSSDTVHELRHAMVGSTPEYVPHVTIGLYAVDTDLDEVRERMAGFDPDPLIVRVDSITLMSYASSDIAGKLTTIGRVDLSTSTWIPV